MDARARAIDAVMTYWLNGCEDERLLEWWTSPEAVEAATEIVDAVFAVVFPKGGAGDRN